MKNKSWEEQVEEEVRQEMSHSGDFYFSLPSPADAFKKTMDDQIDELEAVAFKEGNLVDCPLKHVFTPGLYTRTILMETGALITSLKHREHHQYIISKGVALVKIGEGEWQRLSAPYIGQTLAGTRRVLLIESECVWTTCHKTDIMPVDDSEAALAAAVELVEDQIFIKRENPLLGGLLKNNVLIKTIDK